MRWDHVTKDHVLVGRNLQETIGNLSVIYWKEALGERRRVMGGE